MPIGARQALAVLSLFPSAREAILDTWLIIEMLVDNFVCDTHTPAHAG